MVPCLLSPASFRLLPLSFSSRISEGYLCVPRPRSRDEWPCSVWCLPPPMCRTGGNWWRLRGGGAPRKQRGQGRLTSQGKGPPWPPFSTPLSGEPCFHNSPRFRFGFWDCYLLGCESHPPPRSVALGGVRAGCEQKRAN